MIPGQNDLIDEDTREMLEGVMDIADQRVRDIMIPRSQMITLKRNQSLDECLDVIIESAHSRFPVISEDKDHIEGILMAKRSAAVYAQRCRSLQHGKSVTPGRGCAGK
ncbi:Magnesium and cobalt efflux protein CorC [Enterobacter cloacae]|uniref:Magnesium and cobalt efflux protein CorC n=1 Tax=Enterobacter cloacae TaxID=550 RepID=A0A377M4C2_ENTCL|nr:Magnesium and cobalt efflux protein CorC [Enterobacter cloacae]